MSWLSILAAGTPAAAVPTYYYSNDGTLTNDTSDHNNFTSFGARVTVGKTGTAVKIGFLANTFGLSKTCKVALYDNSATPVLIASGGSVSCTVNGSTFYEVTISASVTSSTIYQVWVAPNDDGTYMNAKSGNYARIYSSSNSYSAFPLSTSPVSYTDTGNYGFVMGIQVQ
jgi:hypothetical protein